MSFVDSVLLVIASVAQRQLARQVGYRNVESVVLWSNLPLRIDVAPTE